LKLAEYLNRAESSPKQHRTENELRSLTN